MPDPAHYPTWPSLRRSSSTRERSLALGVFSKRAARFCCCPFLAVTVDPGVGVVSRRRAGGHRGLEWPISGSRASPGTGSRSFDQHNQADPAGVGLSAGHAPGPSPAPAPRRPDPSSGGLKPCVASVGRVLPSTAPDYPHSRPTRKSSNRSRKKQLEPSWGLAERGRAGALKRRGRKESL